MQAPLPTRTIFKNIVLTILPAVVLFSAGAIANNEWGLLIVMAEPLLLCLGLYVLGWSILSRQSLLAGATAASLVAGAFSLHEPHGNSPPLVPGPTWLRDLRGCTLLVKPTTGPVRLVTWTIEGLRGVDEGLDEILSVRPDIIVINGSDDPRLGSRLQQALGGEAKFFQSHEPTRGMMAVVRGSFQYCGGDEDEWRMELPAHQNSTAEAILGFPHVEDIGVVPLLITRMDQPIGVLDWPDWGRRVVDSAIVNGEAVRTLGSKKMVLLGDMGAPPSSLALSQPLQAAGLSVAASTPNWPTNIQGVPFWTQHALDQVWTGRDWHVQSSHILPSKKQTRAPIVVDLIPNQSQ